MALLQVLTSQKVVRGTGKRRTPVRTVVVLYQVGLHGLAGDHVRITDKPAGLAQADLLVTARGRAGAAGANVRVTVSMLVA